MGIELRAELRQLRRAILSMGAEVERNVAFAVDAVTNDDIDKAVDVQDRDDEIDEMDLDIEAECLRVLALCHPVAGDLRFILAVMRINTDLERIADLAKSIGKRVVALQHAYPLDVPGALRTMCRSTRQMVTDALKALADRDADLARRVRRDDQRVDDLQKEIFAWAQDAIVRNVETTEAAIDFLSVARKLERIADHCTNIAEDVIFLTEGSVVRHSSVM